YVDGKPSRLFEGIVAGEGLHFLSVPAPDELRQAHHPARLTAADYPALLGDAEPVETLSVPCVVAAYAWPTGSERYRKVARFVDAFFERLETLKAPPRHPKWQAVDVATALPGWTRFPAAEEWLALHHSSAARSAGDSPATAINDPAQREGLFREFQASLAIAPGR